MTIIKNEIKKVFLAILIIITILFWCNIIYLGGIYIYTEYKIRTGECFYIQKDII